MAPSVIRALPAFSLAVLVPIRAHSINLLGGEDVVLEKTTEERMAELEASSRLIHKCMQPFHNERDDCYLVGVLSQLRALVSFNPREPREKRRALKPLLLDLADRAGVPLELFSIPPKPEHGPKGLVGAILASKTWSVSPVPGYQKYALEEWPLAPAYHVDSKYIYKPRNDVIRQLTEKGAVQNLRG
jgi:hypothetical protein